MITEHIFDAEIEVPLNPFPGLRPFEFNESNLYFGRDGQSERMLSKLAARRFVAVVGTSGSGKSSLVRAGLLPALYGGFMTSAGSNWRVALMRPGSDPLGNLARALNEPGVFGSDDEENAALQTVITEATLRRGSRGLVEAVRQTRMPANENLLVVVDQFEELFRFTRVAEGERYHNEAAAFVKLLLEAIGQREVPLYVVLTLRSDYLGDCALFWDLPEAINESQFLIPRLTREQRREAITGPVAVCGGEIAPRLVNRLLNDVGDDQDQLPILQHALMRAWDCWRADHADGEPIDLRHYEAIGTMSEALSRHADEAYGELPPGRARLAEKMFKALTEKGADNREIRRPLELREVCALLEAPEEEVVAVVEPFRREGRSFLMPPAGVPLTPESVIDISHESLIRCWGRLREWVEEEARSARIYRRLAETAALYRGGEAQLLRDPELQLALIWRAENHPNEVWARRYHADFGAAMEFLEQSRKVRDREAQEKEVARRRELRRVRLVAAVLLILLLVSIAATGVALAARREAVQKTEQLERQTRIAEAEKANAQKQSRVAQEQKELAEARRVEAEENFNAAEKARDETLEQKQRAEEEARRAHENELKALSASAEARRQESLAHAQEKAAHEAERTALLEAARANNLLYAADLSLAQQTFRSGGAPNARALLDEAALIPNASADQKASPGFEWYYLWKIFHYGDGDVLEGVGGDNVTAVAFSPDNTKIATANRDGTVKLWDALSRREVAAANWGARPLSLVTSATFSPDGRLLAIADGDAVRLWDTAEPRKEPAELRGQGVPLYSVAFSPDGRALAAASRDNSVLLWRLNEPGRGPLALGGHTGVVRAVAFSPDGRMLASGSNDRTIKLWDLTSPEPKSQTLNGHTRPVLSLSFSVDGRRLASGGDDGAIGLWDVRAPASPPVMLKEHKGAVGAVAYSPDGRTLATGGEDGLVMLWDTKTPSDKPTAIKAHREAVSSVAFSRDGRVLATGSSDKRVLLWDISQFGLAAIRGTGAEVTALAYSPDGRTLATGNAKGDVQIWDSRSRRELAGFKASAESVLSVAYSPDGTRLATIGQEPAIKLWRLDEPGRPAGELRVEETRALPPGAAFFSVAYSPDGSRLAAGYVDGTIKVWNLRAPGAGPRTLAGHGKTVTALAYSPDGRTLVSGGLDGMAALWDLTAESPRPVVLERQELPIWAAVFSPDGARVATGGDDALVKVWDVATRSQLGVLKGHSLPVKAVAFSPGGRTIATGSNEGWVKLWSGTTLKELVALEDPMLKKEEGLSLSHWNPVSAVAFSPDGSTLASGSFDGYVKFWYAATPEEVTARRR